MTIPERESRLLFALAEELHFGRAAERLGVAQPHLSGRLRAIEERLGLKLFERRPVRPTPAGEIVLAAARRAEEDLQAALRHARGVAAGQFGSVVVGFASSVAATELPALFRRFRDQNPTIELKLREMHSAQQWAALESGVLDAGVTREIQSSRQIRTQAVLREPFVAALPASHPLASRDTVWISELVQHAFVLFPREVAPALHAQIMGACAAGGGAPRVVQEAEEWHTILALVAAGFGVTLAPWSLHRLTWPGLVYRELKPQAGYTSLHLCWNDRRPNPARDAFVEAMLRACTVA
jgi:DNA-binding transcriptional LysR family regulator